MIRALSLDGGGVRVKVQADICREIEQASGRAIRETFDLIGGTSAGGILALGLAAGIHAEHLAQWYAREVGKAFQRPWQHRVSTANGLRGPKYPGAGLRAVLDSLFGDRILSDLGPHIVTTFDLRSKTDCYPGDIGRRAHWRASEAAYATSAAPTYFPPADIYGGAYVDGGVWANNPAPYVATEVRDRWPGEDLTLVALGNRSAPTPEPELDPWGWGLMQWATRFTSTFMEPGASSGDRTVERSLKAPSRYVRVRPDWGNVKLDEASPSAVKTLELMARDTFHAYRPALESVWQL